MKLLIIAQLGFKKIWKIALDYVSALAACLYLLTFGLLSQKHREFMGNIRHAVFPRKGETLQPMIPKIGQERVLDSGSSVVLKGLQFENGNITLTELTIIANLTKSLRPKSVFEFGTFNGRTTLNLMANAPEGSVIYTLDLPGKMVNKTALEVEAGDKLFIAKSESGERFKKESMAGRQLTQLYGDSASFDFSPYYNSIDFVFVDAAHSYEYVRNDSRVALKLLRNGKGIILWHDYDKLEYWPGLLKALNELFISDPAFKDLKHIDGTSLVYLRKI